MSLANSPAQDRVVQTDDCARDGCDVEFPIHSAVAGSFCSTDCVRRDRGRRIRRQITDDHRYCATCFARLKDTVPPGDDWCARHGDTLEAALDQGAEFTSGETGTMTLDVTGCGDIQTTSVDAVIGFEYLTSASTHGLRSLPDDGAGDRSVWAPICQCGNTEHDHHEPAFNGDDVRRRARNLVATLHELYREDKLPHDIDERAVVRNVLVDGELSWARAIGAGLEAAVSRSR